ncbi:transcriptional regulator [Niallia circulans]|jgi:AcrR family transcriptional regulator|uniref:forespore capture DNA-binding protein RefZ n=1 Tax=Shouchella clausii TaxID=79880 RepID=UPI000BA54315|nr:forespore capture DNA-binding protein RefZ [Shouchella clausii]MCM3547526.1 forespore capture DNA-binding protein RefZ [Shouchella clausii]PAF16260.1 hypothetical protein CHH59_00730 [Shouchella clausii]SPT80572.1 transcriptional regulator [Niallia circulans]
MSEQTKTTIKDAAISLFYAKGFHGTSVRDIARKAGVNPALISYYFGGKQALFESLLIDFFEGYVKTMETAAREPNGDPIDSLVELFNKVLLYQQSCHWLARMAHREMTLDSTLVREVMSTYLRKEQHLLEQAVARCLRRQGEPLAADLIVVQLRNMMTLPFSSPQYLRELFLLTPADEQFIERYGRHADEWIRSLLSSLEQRKTMVVRLTS